MMMNEDGSHNDECKDSHATSDPEELNVFSEAQKNNDTIIDISRGIHLEK